MFDISTIISRYLVSLLYEKLYTIDCSKLPVIYSSFHGGSHASLVGGANNGESANTGAVYSLECNS